MAVMGRLWNQCAMCSIGIVVQTVCGYMHHCAPTIAITHAIGHESSVTNEQ